MFIYFILNLISDRAFAATDAPKVYPPGSFSNVISIHSLANYIGNFYRSISEIFYIILGVAAIIYILWAAFQMITSNGDKTKFSNGKQSIINAIIGIIIIISCYGIIRLAGGIGSLFESYTSTNTSVNIDTQNDTDYSASPIILVPDSALPSGSVTPTASTPTPVTISSLKTAFDLGKSDGTKDGESNVCKDGTMPNLISRTITDSVQHAYNQGYACGYDSGSCTCKGSTDKDIDGRFLCSQYPSICDTWFNNLFNK